MICDTCKKAEGCCYKPEDGEDGVQFCGHYIWDGLPDTVPEDADSVPFTPRHVGRLCTEDKLCKQ